jgi:hypothetical protein
MQVMVLLLLLHTYPVVFRRRACTSMATSPHTRVRRSCHVHRYSASAGTTDSRPVLIAPT